MKQFYITCIIIFSLKATSFCQIQNSNWYFGDNAGIKFNAGNVTTLTDGVMRHTEGVASISDENGNLQFFTNGINVWDASKNIMPNGTGLLGDNSAAQILIVPKPGDCNIYYIFTTASQNINNPLCYSVVDMSRNNELGEVIEKNTVIRTAVSERITATLKSNGSDYWVITQEVGSNNFLVYSLTSAGFNNNPIVQPVGVATQSSDDVVGCIKVSPNGKKIVTTCEIGHKQNQLFDFDNVTGTISNAIILNNEQAYGAEFSADNNKLYLARYYPLQLVQYDIINPAEVAIQNSKFEIINTVIGSDDDATLGGALQRGPDDKIYLCRANTPFLDVINNPNAAAIMCNYTQAQINLGNKFGLGGLPNFVSNYAPNQCGGVTATAVNNGCSNQNNTITATAIFGATPYTYALDNGNYQTSNVFNNVSNGTYRVSAKDANGQIQKTKVIIDSLVLLTLNIQNQKQPTCGVANGSVTVSAKNGVLPYQFSTNNVTYQTSNVFNNLLANNYIFYVKDAANCVTSLPLLLINSNVLKVNAGRDTGIFINLTIPLFATDVSNSNFNNFEWMPTEGLNNPFIQNPIATITKNIQYVVTASNAAGCTTTDTIKIEVYKTIDIYVPNVFTPNNDGLNDILKPIPRGIKQLKYFNIYNRYGQKIFATNAFGKGWDGTINGLPQNTGTFVWQAEGVDVDGKTIVRRGVVMLVR